MAKSFKVNSKYLPAEQAPLHENHDCWTLVINDDIECYLTEIRPGGCARLDNHVDSDHVFYFLSGYGYQILDGERFEFGPNDCVFIPRLTDHELYVTGQETVRFLAIHSPARACMKDYAKEWNDNLPNILKDNQ